MHRPDVLVGEIARSKPPPRQVPALGHDVTERAQHVDTVKADLVIIVHPAQDAQHGLALGRHPFAFRGTGHVDPATGRVRGMRAAGEGRATVP